MRAKRSPDWPFGEQCASTAAASRNVVDSRSLTPRPQTRQPKSWQLGLPSRLRRHRDDRKYIAHFSFNARARASTVNGDENPRQRAQVRIGHLSLSPPYGPMDFAGWFEAFLGGRWYTFDTRQYPSNSSPAVAPRNPSSVTHAFSSLRAEQVQQSGGCSLRLIAVMLRPFGSRRSGAMRRSFF